MDTSISDKLRFVRSNFHGCWRGVVLDWEYPPYYKPKRKYLGRPSLKILKIVILLDKRGNRMKRRLVRQLNEYWLDDVEPFDISWVNPDWLRKDNL